jgi:molecular chaperone GrpE
MVQTPDPRERAFALMRKNRPARKRAFALRRGAPGSIGRLRRELGGGDPPSDNSGNNALAETQLVELRAENKRASEELAQYRDALARLKADMDNFRKRVARDREQTRASATEDLLKDLVPVLDSFDLALAYGTGAADPEKSLRGVVDGVRMIHKQLGDAFQSRGVSRIADANVPFDPQLHEAVAMVDPAPGQAENVVSDIIQAGYMLGERVVRPAKVRITRKMG